MNKDQKAAAVEEIAERLSEADAIFAVDYRGISVPEAAEQFSAIARLPGLDVLHGQLVGVTASPLTGLTRGLASMLSGLAVAMGEIAEKGLVGGEEPAAEPAAEA